MTMKAIGRAASVLAVLVGACGGAKQEPNAPTGPSAETASDLESPEGEATGPLAEESTEAEIATGPTGAEPEGEEEWGIVGAPSHAAVVERVVGMVSDPAVRRGAARRGLGVMNVMWEDTGRSVGSALGPNITDLTLQVRYRRGAGSEAAALMPVIRFPNFTDRTGDVPANKLWVRVGNHRNKKDLRTVPLTDVLKNLRGYAAKPWTLGGGGNLLAKRDTHFLMSAQAVFLPIPKEGKAEFNPVVFNYQSAPGSPAVLTLLVTRQGTSISVIENSPGDSTVVGYGQELYFNDEGERAPFTAERRSDVKARIDAKGGPEDADDRSALQKGADVLMLVQVPLKHKEQGMLGSGGSGLDAMMGVGMGAGSGASGMGIAPPSAAAPSRSRAGGGPVRERSDVEQAVLGHGERKGPYAEGVGTKLVRDERFPIRVTMQFYKATSNGVVSEGDLDGIARVIGSVYEHADYVGSLVIPEDDTRRPTAWRQIPRDWFSW
jgi:hypothetical protein